MLLRPRFQFVVASHVIGRDEGRLYYDNLVQYMKKSYI